MTQKDPKGTTASRDLVASISRCFFAACLCALCVFVVPNGSSAHETLTTTVLFDREIVRILNKHSVMCHVENGPSLPLSTFGQTWLQGRKVRAQVIRRPRPPWA